MQSGHATQLQTPSQTPPPLDTVGALEASIAMWRGLAVDLPLRVAAEAMRFTSRRLQAQADHLAAMARCGSLKAVVELHATFLSEGVADYQAEATTLSRDVADAAFAKAA